VFSNTCPVEGENVTIYSTVHNIGEAEAQNVAVTFYVDDVQLGAPKTIPSILAGGDATVTNGWIVSQLGSHVMKVRVDTLVEKNKGNNVATRALIVGKHDVALLEIVRSKTVICEGYVLGMNLTVTNEGQYSENVQVILYAGTSLIQTGNVTPGSNMSVVFFGCWNTTGYAYGNYTISAELEPLDGETDVADNTLTDGWVIVAMVGDITGPDGWPDGDCDIRDVSAVARLFGVSSPSPEYNPNFDINGDGDIDIKDVSTVARHLGEHV
jgi:hypothetical protein